MNYYPRLSPHFLTFLGRLFHWVHQAVGLLLPSALKPALRARDFAPSFFSFIQAPVLRRLEWLWWVLGSLIFLVALVFYFQQIFTHTIR